MLDLIFTLGQAASALLLVYGGFLVLAPARKRSEASDELVLLRHLQKDA